LGLKDYIRAAKAGDQKAFTYLLEKYWNDIYRFQSAQINNANEAEDITIETFAKAFEKIHTFDEKYSFKNWLLTISKNTYLDLKRKKKQKETFSLDSDIPEKKRAELLDIADADPEEDEWIWEQKLKKIHQAMARLKPKYREVLKYRFFDGLSYKQIADISGESISNVKIRLMRAKKLLAAQLKNEWNELDK